jgi:hypothetical protein
MPNSLCRANSIKSYAFDVNTATDAGILTSLGDLKRALEKDLRGGGSGSRDGERMLTDRKDPAQNIDTPAARGGSKPSGRAAGSAS